MLLRFILLVFMISFLTKGYAQKPQKDSLDPKLVKILADTNQPKKHSATTATLLSVCLPGAGQLYNKKYWKAPIVWAGMGTCAYFIIFNQKNYTHYRDAYIYKTDNDPATEDPYPNADATQVYQVRDYYRDNRDLSWILIGLVYVLNILDATVDAYLYDFDLNNTVSLEVKPTLFSQPQSNTLATGINLTFKIK